MKTRFISLAGVALAFSVCARGQSTYTWVTTTNLSGWNASTNWSPNIAGGPGPTGTATDVSGTTPGSCGLAGNSESVGTIITAGTGAWIIEASLLKPSTFTVGTADVPSGTLFIRGSSNAPMTLDLTNVEISGGGVLNLGYAPVANELTSLSGLAGGGVAFSGSGGNLNLNVLSSYSLGLVSTALTGTTEAGIFLATNSDTTAGPETLTVTATGLSSADTSTGVLTLTGADGTVGGTLTLAIANSGSTNYSSDAILQDKLGTPTAGSLALTVGLTGSGTQTLTGASTFSGGTTINSGTLYVSNTTTTGGSGLGGGPVTVAAGATLGGSGTIVPVTSNVTIAGTLSPGDLVTPTGTLTFAFSSGNELVFSPGSQLDVILGTASSGVAFTGTGGPWLSGSGNWTLNLTAGAGFQIQTPYTVFANALTSGFAPQAVNFISGSNTYSLASTAYSFTTDGTNYYLTLTGPIIGTPPASASATVGGGVSFTVAATGTGTLTYQWYFNSGSGAVALTDGSGISGSATANLNLSDLQAGEAGSYTCAITDAIGTVTSPAAALTLGSPPAIGTEPASASVASGGSTSFTVVATGTGTISYQWYFNGGSGAVALTDGSGISGSATATLSLSNVQPSEVGQYYVVVTDTGGPTTSSAATLSLSAPPVFTIQPASVTLAAGQTASFYAPATGAGTVTYQWYLNNTAVGSATDPYLLVTPVSSANAGSYTCIATDSTGSTTSSAATLTLSASADLGRLTNVSVRTNCGTGSANIIAGFVLGGAGNTGSSKSMLIRADGPELANFGVPGFLPDPSLDVFNTSGSSPVSVGQNTGWCVTQTNENNVIAADSAVYAFPLTTNSASSATVLALPPAQYTENVTGVSGDTGIALAEVYDVTNATETYSASLPRLINVSARANVATGAGNLIAGFTIGGSTDKTVLVRGTGPGLSEFGLTGLLDQPTLAVYSTSSGDTLVATNTGWAEDSVLTAAGASVYAFAQTSSADCALLVTLPPGTYTANLNSNDGTSGLALVEVYEVP